MRNPRFGTLGEILSGEDAGRFVEILDDKAVSGGLLIFVYERIDRSGASYDYWLESADDFLYLEAELGWQIRWL